MNNFFFLSLLFFATQYCSGYNLITTTTKGSSRSKRGLFPSLSSSLSSTTTLKQYQRIPTRYSSGRIYLSSSSTTSEIIIDNNDETITSDQRDEIKTNKLEETTTTGDITKQENNNNTTKTINNKELLPPPPTFRECLGFVLPALGIYACPPLMSLIDASFVGRGATATVVGGSSAAAVAAAVATLELAALGPATTISDSAALPLLFISIASTNLVAKAFADKDNEMLTQITKTTLTMGTIGGIILSALTYIFAKPLSIVYCSGGSKTTAGLALACSKYVAIRALALPAVVIATIAQAICIGTKDTTTPMISVLIAGLANFLGDLILVSKLNTGIAGAAIATAISQILSAGLLLRSLYKKNKSRWSIKETTTNSSRLNNKKKNNNKNNTMMYKQVLSFLPFLFVMGVKIGWHNACAATAASMGGTRAAAQTALISVGILCMTFGDVGSSLSQAFLPAFVRNQNDEEVEKEKSSTTVGERTDNKEEKKRRISSKNVSKNKKSSSSLYFDLNAAMPTIRQLLKTTLSISTTVVLLATTIVTFFGKNITSDPAVLIEMKKALPYLAMALSFHGTAVTLEGLLLSQKKFRGLTAWYTILIPTIAAFQIAIKNYNLGLPGIWSCYAWISGSRIIVFSALGGLLSPLWKKISTRQKGRKEEKQKKT